MLAWRQRIKALKSEETAKKTFEEHSAGEGLPLFKINKNMLGKKTNIIDLVLLTKLETSKVKLED